MKRHYNQQISIDMQSLTVELVHSYSHASDIELTMYIMLYVVPWHFLGRVSQSPDVDVRT